jgi:broad specificity phosphatase PhoE
VITNLMLVRHGQSTWNAEGRWQGQADPPLTDFGRKQAKTASKKIGQIHAIVSSSQIRALETATVFSTAIGVEPVVTHDGLVERNAGEWSGLTKTEIDEQYPGYLEDNKRPPSYESDDSLLQRTSAAMTEIVVAYPGAEILVASHGGVIKTFVESLGTDPLRVPNLGGWMIRHDGSAFVAVEPLALLPDDLSTGGQHMRV